MITKIIPEKSIFYDKQQNEVKDFDFTCDDQLDLKAICIFSAIGFFLDDTTYFQNLKVARPCTEYHLDNNKIIDTKTSWNWHHSPRDISFSQAVEEFSNLFEKVTKEQTDGKDIILPLSGGLDSRSQAAVLGRNKTVNAYSYEFEGGINENKYGQTIAQTQHFNYSPMTIPASYLWDGIEDLARLNHCLSDFTHQRQMAVKDRYKSMGNVFFLGHWGDVLFDDMGVDNGMSDHEMTDSILKKIVKKGGREIGKALWEAWGLDGSFESELRERIAYLMSGIDIENANAKIRAFKSLYWAPRWTSTNLCVFNDSHEMALPYYHDEMCKFICTLPEKHLAARKMQIEYIKLKSPSLAKIPWQSYDPCNLYNYGDYYKPKYLPIRTFRNLKRNIGHVLFNKSKLITRNWEIQFCGEKNENRLKNYLFNNQPFQDWIPEELTRNIFSKFKENDDVYYSHPLSMLLTLSVFAKLRQEK